MGDVILESELDRPTLRRKHVVATNDGTTRTVIDAGDYGVLVTDEPVSQGGRGSGPSPLQTVLGALCGCESVTFHRTAADLDFAYDGITFEAGFTIDIRGRQGDRAVRPHFQTVRLIATVTSAETVARLEEVVEETEARCPVYNLLSDAGVDVQTTWVLARDRR